MGDYIVRAMSADGFGKAAAIRSTEIVRDVYKRQLHNCPRLSDVAAAAEILEHLGCRVDRTGHSIWVDAQDLCRDEIPRALMERMRSSILFLGPLLARTGPVSYTHLMPWPWTGWGASTSRLPPLPI